MGSGKEGAAPPAGKDADQRFYTDPALAVAVVKRLAEAASLPAAPIILEPSAGNGSFIPAIYEVAPRARVYAVDVNVEELALFTSTVRVLQGRIQDYAATWAASPKARFNLIVGNPPFVEAEEHIRCLFPLLAEPCGGEPAGMLAFLLRDTFFGGAERMIEFWEDAGFADRLRFVIPIAKRPSFTGHEGAKTTDSIEYRVYCFQRGWSGVTQWLRPVWATGQREKFIQRMNDGKRKREQKA